MLLIISIILCLQSLLSKTLVFPFKKLTIEYLITTKSISDFINFHIYTNISIGTPKKSVAHFITSIGQSFSYDTMHLHYRGGKVNNIMQKEIEKSLDIFYFPENSSTFEQNDINENLYSDIYYFYNLNEDEINKRINISIVQKEKDQNLCGIIDLFYQDESNLRYKNKNFIKICKDNNIITDTYITFVYPEYNLNNNLSYFNDDYNDILGKLIIGDSPHKFAPEKYKEKDEIKINGIFALNINEIKFKYNLSNYIETNSRLNLKFHSEFILGSNTFRDEIDNIFFEELFSKKICKKDYIAENIYISQSIIYSCENNKGIQEKIKSFPTVYLEIKEYNITFLFNYKELFKLHNNRLYFLVMFKTNSHNWEIGELFFRKYIASINYYSKTISFYKTQIEEINSKTEFLYPNKATKTINNNRDNNNIFVVKIIIYLLFGLIIIAGIAIGGALAGVVLGMNSNNVFTKW